MESEIRSVLARIAHPETGRDIAESGMVDSVSAADGKVTVVLRFPKARDPFAARIRMQAEQALKERFPEAQVTVAIKEGAPKQQPPKRESATKSVGKIIAVASGKGGVGKSTVTANLAATLRDMGYRVGILDADIYGPSQPKMFGLENEELYMHEVEGRNLIIPAEKYGVKVLSIGFLIDPASAAVWRGAMASNALKQLIEQADWGELDYFLIDMPPGTSDIHLTLVQTLGITGAVVVTTPQQVALADARKGIAMFRDDKINVPVLGLVDNMAWFTPEKHPDERYFLFGPEGAVDALAAEYGVPVLARIPLVAAVGEHSDNGSPIALENTASALAFVHLAHELIDAVDRRNNELPPTSKVEMR